MGLPASTEQSTFLKDQKFLKVSVSLLRILSWTSFLIKSIIALELNREPSKVALFLASQHQYMMVALRKLDKDIAVVDLSREKG